jgi:hypothetical protein
MYTLYNNPGFDPETGTELQHAIQSEIDEKKEWLKKQEKSLVAEVKPAPQTLQPPTIVVQPIPKSMPLQVKGVPIAENSVVYEKGPGGTINKTETFNGEVTQSVLYPKKVDKEKPENVTADVNIP